MKKLLLISSCLLFSTAVSTTTYAFDCKKLSYNCGEYGYTNNKATLGYCTNGWVACPIDANYRRCDAEASSGDFKFSRVSVDTSKSWRTNSNQAGKFIQAASSSQSGCALTNNSYESVSYYPSHTHAGGAELWGGTLLNFDRARASAYTTNNIWLDRQDRAAYTTSSSYSYYAGTAAPSASETRPYNYTVYGYNYTGTTSGTITGYNVFTSSNTTQPTCASLGYVHKTNQCPNATSYIVCPFDNTAVLCDLEAEAGEIKFSKRSGDHNGWLQVNNGKGGRTLSNIGDAYYNSELGKKKNITTLPNYSAAFLRVTGGNASTSFTVPQNDAIADHSHAISNASIAGKNSDKLYHKKGSDNYYAPYDSYTTTLWTKVNSCSEGESYCPETYPNYYGANVFIYTGLLNAN